MRYVTNLPSELGSMNQSPVKTTVFQPKRLAYQTPLQKRDFAILKNQTKRGGINDNVPGYKAEQAFFKKDKKELAFEPSIKFSKRGSTRQTEPGEVDEDTSSLADSEEARLQADIKDKLDQ